ncbi:MAG: activator of Hsp90 ATPase 1 family protein, partial [Firmicutes bacterium]|nr:activator of Hsp90 ATPase 1 family protein [Bacillota bacterium]
MQGSVVKTDAGHQAHLQLFLDYEVERVWAALTEPKLLVKWLA